MYLRRFATSAKEVVLVDRDDLTKSEVMTTKQAMQIEDFYGWDTGYTPEEIEDPAMLDPEHIEKLLGAFESRASGAFDRMLESGRPPQTAKDRYHLTHYIALQAARGQRFREDLTQIATLTMRRCLPRFADAVVESRHASADRDPGRCCDGSDSAGETTEQASLPPPLFDGGGETGRFRGTCRSLVVLLMAGPWPTSVGREDLLVSVVAVVATHLTKRSSS